MAVLSIKLARDGRGVVCAGATAALTTESRLVVAGAASTAAGVSTRPVTMPSNDTAFALATLASFPIRSPRPVEVPLPPPRLRLFEPAAPARVYAEPLLAPRARGRAGARLDPRSGTPRGGRRSRLVGPAPPPQCF